MYKVEVENECGCFKKSEYQKEKSFEDKDEAVMYVDALVELMNDEFCGKHSFIPASVSDNHVKIIYGGSKAGGCCGGGHCG